MEIKEKKENLLICAVVLVFSFCVLNLTGCVVRTYQMTKDRSDQDLYSGNRGYVGGQKTEEIPAEGVKKTRTIQAVEIELHSPIKFERVPKKESIQKAQEGKNKDNQLWGNRGFITESISPEVDESIVKSSPVKMEQYTVQKDDTLQKISQKFYGTTRKWSKIYEANKGILRGPDKIYSGQVINIPVEPLKETKENLK